MDTCTGLALWVCSGGRKDQTHQHLIESNGENRLFDPQPDKVAGGSQGMMQMWDKASVGIVFDR